MIVLLMILSCYFVSVTSYILCSVCLFSAFASGKKLSTTTEGNGEQQFITMTPIPRPVCDTDDEGVVPSQKRFCILEDLIYVHISMSFELLFSRFSEHLNLMTVLYCWFVNAFFFICYLCLFCK